ncbi:MAG: PAS domain-containing protein [Acidobacteria bacterium]|nr:PAS domain-containing protein [Acidobacteriota bacterium]
MESGLETRTVVFVSGLVIASWIGFSFAVRSRASRPLQTASNLLLGLREGDTSMRIRGVRNDDAYGELLREAHALADILSSQRIGAVEATNLLRTVLAGIDVAVFAFDADGRLRLANRAAEALFGRPQEELTNTPAAELGLAECLSGPTESVRELRFPNALGRWAVRRGRFREGGLPHDLLVLTNLSRALREEERAAWQRLIRVLGHELNNSLTPIRSLAGSLRRTAQGRLDAEDREDLSRGLAIIEERAGGLARFTEAYARLARVPSPKFASVDLGPLLSSIAALETRIPISVSKGPDTVLEADADLLQQLLINVLRNAVDATHPSGGAVTLSWSVNGGLVEILVEDEGPGLASSANLFVPFFTTKPGGSGIGLVLSRQIAEAHGGSLTLENRTDRTGCLARLTLPAG